MKRKFVKVTWIDSITISSSHTASEFAAMASDASDLTQISVGEILHRSKTHICLASMISVEGSVGLAIKIPRFTITKIEALKVTGKVKL